MWPPPSSPSSPLPQSPASPPRSQENYDLTDTLSKLEDDTAYLENVLYTLKYDLQILNAGTRNTGLIQSRALQLLSELENADIDMEDLFTRLQYVGTQVDTLGIEGPDKELRRQFVVIDKSLVAADQMRKEMKSWADTIYFEAYELEAAEAANEGEVKGVAEKHMSA